MAQCIIMRRSDVLGEIGELPTLPTNVSFDIGSNQVRMRWNNPSRAFAGNYFVYKTSSVPQNINDGTRIDLGTSTSRDITNISNTQYYGRFFPYNSKRQVQTQYNSHSFKPVAFALPKYTGSHTISGNINKGCITMTSSGTLTLFPGTYTVSVVGGGGAGGAFGSFNNYNNGDYDENIPGSGGGGGGGAISKRVSKAYYHDSYTVLIGAGGTGYIKGSEPVDNTIPNVGGKGYDGGQSSALDTIGYGGIGGSRGSGQYKGGNGGAGGQVNYGLNKSCSGGGGGGCNYRTSAFQGEAGSSGNKGYDGGGTDGAGGIGGKGGGTGTYVGLHGLAGGGGGGEKPSWSSGRAEGGKGKNGGGNGVTLGERGTIINHGHATSNTGGGGGGSSGANIVGGSGGFGVVIVYWGGYENG